MILQYLNKKNALRNLSDEEFEDILPQLALELSKESYHIQYTDEQLWKDWNSLKKWVPSSTDETASTTRVGMKLCEHFFPNFFSIKNNKGISFSNSWTPVLLEKVLRWNRKSHSTPYMSELRRGIYFCGGLTKNTMYRPHMAKSIATHYQSKIVLDPCAGWGGRLLGVVAAGSYYIGYEPNLDTYKNLVRLVDFLGITDKVELYNLPAENMKSHEYDMVLTSPPYFNLEIYSESKGQSENYYTTYQEWRDLWLTPLIHNVAKNTNISCWNTHNIGKMKLMDDVVQIHEDMGMYVDKSFALTSSNRQTNQNTSRNKRTKDLTICFKRAVTP
jgi:hypothetical protein